MKKIKIFASNNLSIWSQRVCYLNPINWVLKLHHVKLSQSKNDYLWTDQFYLIDPLSESFNFENIYKQILEENIDIIAFSVYIWNREEFFGLAKYIKEKNPNITIVVGGPDIDAHRDKDFFKKNSFFDWVIYGEGEIAFSRLLDHLAGYEVELINVVDKLGNVYPHEPVNKSDEILKLSPYLEFSEEFSKFVGWLHDQKVFECLCWETTKGCPFRCSFCDWSSGLHHKVRVWGKGELIPNWKKELLLFSEIKLIAIYWTNANIGLTPQDEEIIDFLCELKNQGKHVPIFISTQISKTKKEKSYALIDKMMSNNLVAGVKFDFQDLDPYVLDLIDRPEIPWEDHKILIKNLMSKHTKIRKIYGKDFKDLWWCNFIWGLPGQTLNHLKHNIVEAGKLNIFPTHHIFECLPNSPAADPAYQEKHGMVVKDVYLNVSDGESQEPGPVSSHRSRAVVQTSTLTMKEWYIGVYIFNIYGAMTDWTVQSKYKEIYIGKEEIFYDNMIEFMMPLIEDGYQHFLQSNRIEVCFNGKEMGFQNFVFSYREYLTPLFDNSGLIKKSINDLMSQQAIKIVDFQRRSIYGITPENVSNIE
jgi:hypothetical protein